MASTHRSRPTPTALVGAAAVVLTAATGVTGCGLPSGTSAAPPPKTTTSITASVTDSATAQSPGGSRPAPTGASGDNAGQGPGATFTTPGPSGATPALRYAWCLRQHGLPAVVTDGIVAYEGSDSPGTVQAGAAGRSEIEAACATAHTDYQPPNLDQR